MSTKKIGYIEYSKVTQDNICIFDDLDNDTKNILLIAIANKLNISLYAKNWGGKSTDFKIVDEDIDNTGEEQCLI